MKNILSVIGLLGIAGVSLGAFGAHALQQTLAERGATDTWDTAVAYHLLHTVALLAIASSVERWHQNRILGWFWIGGIILFSGSLYMLALGGPRWLGPVTPVGGVLMIAGWAWVAWTGLRGKAVT